MRLLSATLERDTAPTTCRIIFQPLRLLRFGDNSGDCSFVWRDRPIRHGKVFRQIWGKSRGRTLILISTWRVTLLMPFSSYQRHMSTLLPLVNRDAAVQPLFSVKSVPSHDTVSSYWNHLALHFPLQCSHSSHLFVVWRLYRLSRAILLSSYVQLGKWSQEHGRFWDLRHF